MRTQRGGAATPDARSRPLIQAARETTTKIVRRLRRTRGFRSARQGDRKQALLGRYPCWMQAGRPDLGERCVNATSREKPRQIREQGLPARLAERCRAATSATRRRGENATGLRRRFRTTRRRGATLRRARRTRRSGIPRTNLRSPATTLRKSLRPTRQGFPRPESFPTPDRRRQKNVRRLAPPAQVHGDFSGGFAHARRTVRRGV